VIALDTSLSMSAPGQFEKARQLAHQAIQKASGQISVITFADTATVVGPPSADRSLAIAAVDSARPGVSSTSYRSALNAAANVVLNVNSTTDSSSATTKAEETTVPVGAQESADVTFSVPHGRWAAVTVDDERGVGADNTRYLVLDANARPTILVITSKGDF